MTMSERIEVTGILSTSGIRFLLFLYFNLYFVVLSIHVPLLSFHLQVIVHQAPNTSIPYNTGVKTGVRSLLTVS